MARPEKTAVVEEIRTKLSEADAAVLTESAASPSRSSPSCAARCGRRTPSTRCSRTRWPAAVEAAGLDRARRCSGPTTIAFVKGDAVVAAKALRDFGRHADLVIKGGLLAPVLTPREIAALADVEPREVLLARLAGGFQAPLVKSAGLFSAFTRNFAYGIKAYIDQRVEGGEAAPEPDADPVMDRACGGSRRQQDAPGRRDRRRSGRGPSV